MAEDVGKKIVKHTSHNGFTSIIKLKPYKNILNLIRNNKRLNHRRHTDKNIRMIRCSTSLDLREIYINISLKYVRMTTIKQAIIQVLTKIWRNCNTSTFLMIM